MDADHQTSIARRMAPVTQTFRVPSIQTATGPIYVFRVDCEWKGKTACVAVLSPSKDDVSDYLDANVRRMVGLPRSSVVAVGHVCRADEYYDRPSDPVADYLVAVAEGR